MAQKFSSSCCSYCGLFFPSSCCCSCCGLFSPSSQQSSQQQQQQPISIYSPPLHQSITAHSSTSSPLQEPTPNMTHFKNFLHKFNNISQIDTLISFLEELVKIASGEKSDAGSNSAVASQIHDGQTILKMLDTRFGKRPKNSANSTIVEMQKVCIEGLKGSEKIPQVGIALCMLGSVLERFIKMSENKSECLDILKRMLNLGKQIVQLNEQIPEQKEKLNEGVQRIIEGTIMCTSQLAKANIFRFITIQVSEKDLKDFQNKIDQFCTDIQLWTAIGMGKRLTDIGDRVPKIASESQKIYAYRPTVGIERAQEGVVELLNLNAQDPTVIVVIVHGFGGIGKTTLADAVYAHLNLQSYTHCRIHMDQDCTSNDVTGYQEQILNGLFRENIKLKDYEEGRGRLYSFFEKNPNQPLFLYIDNALKSRDLEKLLPRGLNSCLPRKSRIFVTTRNVQETDIFTGRNIKRLEYDVSPLPETEARKLLLEKVSDNNNDENSIVNLLKLCGGVPLLLELAGSQLALNRGNAKNIVLEMLKQGENVKDRDISDRMVGFVYDRFLPPVQEAFLDIASFCYNWPGEYVPSIVGEEEFRALQAASFVKTDARGGVSVHDIVLARGKKLSQQEGNRITDPESLLECLKNDEKLKKLKGISLTENSEQPPIEINSHHLNCMSNSLKVLYYRRESLVLSREKCQKPFVQLRCLTIEGDVPDLPMELERLEHLVYYWGPMTQGMNLYEFPPSLRYMILFDLSENRVGYSKIPPKVTPNSSLLRLYLYGFKKMQRLPDGVEKLTKLERLTLWDCFELRELPSKLGDLTNLKELDLLGCDELKELPSNFGQLSNLTTLQIWQCSSLPSNLGQLTNLEVLNLSLCSELVELPSDLGQLQNLRKLDLTYCSKLEKWPLSFADLTKMEEINLSDCSLKLKDSLPENIKRNNCTILLE